MLRTALVLIAFTLMTGIANAQNITLKGKLTDKADKAALAGATIRLVSQKDSAQSRMVVTDKQGSFAFNNLEASVYTLYISYSGYEKIQQRINIQASNKDPIPFSLAKSATELTGVTIVAKAAPVRQKADTTEFSASQFKVNPDATAEDLIKKLPGIVIDKAGNVTTMGDQVKKVTVDGREFFGDDATAALKNLPADVIDKIQVFDKLSDQAAFTGFDDGNSTKAINIITKSGMSNGQFGRFYAGYGTDNRYSAGGNVSFFKKDRRISLVGLFNNVNAQNFSSQDLLGVTSSSSGGNRGGNRGGGGGRGGAGGQGGGNFGGGGNNFLVGQTTGISATNSFGINYSDKWNKKTDVSGSYFFNNSNTNNDQSSNMQSLVNNQFNDESDLSATKNYNHRFNLKFDYKIDDKNSLTFSPSISFQKNSSVKDVIGSSYFSKTSPLSTQNSTTTTNTSGYNTNNNLLFRHSFAKKGRTISVNLSGGYNHKTGETYLNSINKYFDTSGTSTVVTDQFKDQLVNGSTYSASLVYTEPVGKKGQLQINYNPSVSKNKSDQETFNFDNTSSKYSIIDTGYSNKFNSTTTSHSAGISYRVGDRDNMFSAGLNYKYLELSSDQVFPKTVSVYKSFNNVLPNLMWRKKISTKSSVNIMFRTSTNAPSISQLQNVIDNSNTLMVTSGNPDLKQQVSNTLSTRYTYTDTKKGTSFFANLFLQQANNYVANATYVAASDSALNSAVTLYRGSQLTKPVNLNGYVSLRSFLTYAMPLKFMKSNLNVNGGLTYSKLPGLNNKISSTSNNYTYNAGLGITSNISQYIDFNVSYNASITNTRNTVDASLNTNYTTQTAGVQLNLLSKKGWFVQNDLSYTGYSGLGAGYNQQYVLCNAGLGKKFLKNQAGELKLSVFDLLKQNQSITRTVDPSYIEDVRNQVLQQYFMLTFTYKLKNFGTAKPTVNTNREFDSNRQGMGNPRGF